MILTKEQMGVVNHFATDAGGEALQKLAKLAYDYYAFQAISQNENMIVAQASGAAKFALWLQALPKALREREI